MEHIIRRTSNPRIIPPTLPNQLQQIIHTRQNIIHKHNRIKILILCVPQLVQGHKRSVSDFSEIFYPMIERASCSRRSPNHNAHTHRPTECVEYPKEGFRLVRRAVFVNGHKNVLVPQHRSCPKQSREQIRNNVKRVVQINSEKVFVVIR